MPRPPCQARARLTCSCSPKASRTRAPRRARRPSLRPARAGAAAGLPADRAGRLARATVAGSGELLHQAPLDAATLRQNVTSPGGTTEAALAVLMANDGLHPLMEKAVMAATKRSHE